MDSMILDVYPCVILPARYGGAYEGGLWVAFAEMDAWDVPEDAFGDDASCGAWWAAHRSDRGVAVGGSPSEAFRRLWAKYTGPAKKEGE